MCKFHCHRPVLMGTWRHRKAQSVPGGRCRCRVRNSWAVSYTLNALSPRDPAIVLLGICPNELKRRVHTKTCTRMLTAVLFRIAQTCKHPRCPSVGKWVNCAIQTMGSYSALKGNELQDTERRGGSLNAHHCVKEASLQSCVLSMRTMWHSGKGKLWRR